MATYSSDKSYQLVQEREIEHKNEFFELQLHEKGNPTSIFFVTNEENLEDAARAIITDLHIQAEEWHIKPHRKL